MLTVIVPVVIGLLALAAALVYRARLAQATGAARPGLSDEMIRRIEEGGSIELDEPLDLDEIQEEESRFWEDAPWEETEEW